MNIFIGLFEHQQYSSLISFLGFHLLWVFSGKIDVMIIETPTPREKCGILSQNPTFPPFYDHFYRGI